MRKTSFGVAAAVAIASSVAATQAEASSNRCLNGFVWREAFTGDDACVTPATRMQAASDNAAAGSRVDPRGAYGPNSCVSGFVWRAARASDLVCVTPATRSQAAADNAAALSRRNSLLMTLSRWTSPNTVTCSGSVCTLVNDSSTSHAVTVTNLNPGTATLFLYRSTDGKFLRKWTAPAVRRSDGPGGRAVFRTNALVCAGSRNNAYFRAQDPVSGLKSDRVSITTGCRPL
jgi:hypothetical protein